MNPYAYNDTPLADGTIILHSVTPLRRPYTATEQARRDELLQQQNELLVRLRYGGLAITEVRQLLDSGTELARLSDATVVETMRCAATDHLIGVLETFDSWMMHILGVARGEGADQTRRWTADRFAAFNRKLDELALFHTTKNGPIQYLDVTIRGARLFNIDLHVRHASGRNMQPADLLVKGACIGRLHSELLDWIRQVKAAWAAKVVARKAELGLPLN